MTFARFMEIALYDPERGYYSTADPRPTREGDFLTAPELHPIFGRAIAHQVAEVWDRLARPVPFVVRELGAGTGALAESVLGGLRRDAPDLAAVVRYEATEHNRHRRADLVRRLEAMGVGDRSTVTAVSSELPDSFVGIVLANELLDALPFHRVEAASDGSIQELLVGLDDDQLVDVPAEPSTPRLLERLATERVELVPGQRAEIRLADEALVASIGTSMTAGVAVVVDYALHAQALYDAARIDGTLVAYVGHRAHADPFRSIGRQDLTAHVDLTALERAATANGLDVLGVTSQAEFLVGNGLEALLEEARRDLGDDLAGWTLLRSAIGRLLDPRAMGAFAVAIMGRGIAPEPPLSGLSFRLPARSAR